MSDKAWSLLTSFRVVHLQNDVKLLTSNALAYFTSAADEQHREANALEEDFGIVVAKAAKKIKKAKRKVDKEFAAQDRKEAEERAKAEADEVRADIVSSWSRVNKTDNSDTLALTGG